MPKTVPLSVRIPYEDAEFLAELNLDSAATPSDKVRSIISQYRVSTINGNDGYKEVLGSLNELLGPKLNHLKQLQYDNDVHSELFRILAEWLPDMLAHFLSGSKKVDSVEGLKKLESNLCDKVFALMESVLRLGVTTTAPCIDDAAILKRVDRSIELVDAIKK